MTFPQSLILIGNRAFKGCAGPHVLRLPHGLMPIGDSAFRYCTGFDIGENSAQRDIHRKNAFSDCRGLASVTIPGGVTSIGGGAFDLMIFYAEDARQSLNIRPRIYQDMYSKERPRI
ncbi:MAG: leucine-rich repeat domain-containing protein [Candidatus Methanomethylophilaceae archaeon]